MTRKAIPPAPDPEPSPWLAVVGLLAELDHAIDEAVGVKVGGITRAELVGKLERAARDLGARAAALRRAGAAR